MVCGALILLEEVEDKLELIFHVSLVFVSQFFFELQAWVGNGDFGLIEHPEHAREDVVIVGIVARQDYVD